jgi:hypothetical protein
MTAWRRAASMGSTAKGTGARETEITDISSLVISAMASLCSASAEVGAGLSLDVGAKGGSIGLGEAGAALALGDAGASLALGEAGASMAFEDVEASSVAGSWSASAAGMSEFSSPTMTMLCLRIARGVGLAGGERLSGPSLGLECSGASLVLLLQLVGFLAGDNLGSKGFGRGLSDFCFHESFCFCREQRTRQQSVDPFTLSEYITIIAIYVSIHVPCYESP